MKLILPFLLHHANRCIKDVVVGMDNFYVIKDRILKKHGTHVNYDVQKIDGKKCYSCDGRGVFKKLDQYRIWNFEPCWHCHDGWYRLPKWICLSRIKFGPYHFHKPLQRVPSISNPFSKENIGWQVTDRPVIQGYIEHRVTYWGIPCLLILFLMYDSVAFFTLKKRLLDRYRSDWRWRFRRIKKIFSPSRLLVDKPKLKIHYLDETGNIIDDMPF